MFTGLVETTGTLLRTAPLGDGRRLAVAHPGWERDLEPGASVAVDGCCLTVVECGEHWFEVEVTLATLAHTRFGDLTPGEVLNLERPLALGERFGGHWVQGHVDGLLAVARIERSQETCYVDLFVPVEAREWVVPQGSIALNGVSLTVQDVERETARVAIIPHTWTSTNLSRLAPGSSVHVEYDVLAKYVTAALRRHLASHARSP